MLIYFGQFSAFQKNVRYEYIEWLIGQGLHDTTLAMERIRPTKG